VTNIDARIAILVQNLPVPFDRRVWQEARTLAAAGADVTVICPGDERHPAGTFEIEGVRVLRYEPPTEAKGLAGYANEYGFSLRRMSKLFEAERKRAPFDIVHFCNPPDLLYRVALPAKRKDGSVLVFDQHDVGPELVEAKHMPLGKLLVAVARFFEARTYTHADHVISTNESYRRIAIERGRFAPEDVTVVRSGPYRDWVEAQAPDDAWRRGRKHLIGYLGVMGRQEGIEYLLEAVDLLAAKGLDVQLALVGSGPDRERLEAIAAERGITDRVEFHGRVDDRTMQSILAAADVCVNPDEVNPMNDLSTMNKIIEYMALGKPIVQFDLKEGRFSAQDASVYADRPNDAESFARAIESVLIDPDTAAAMGARGRRRFEEELSWDSQGSKLVNAFAGLLARRRTTVSA
jgi:glycosyltransferase involved in cell wall biosynthesis